MPYYRKKSGYPAKRRGGSQFVKTGSQSYGSQYPSSQITSYPVRGQYTGTGKKNTTVTVKHVIVNGQGPSMNGTTITPTTTNTSLSADQISKNSEMQKLIRETYKRCLVQAAQSGKFMTSLQRQSLLQAVTTEAGLQQQPGLQGSTPAAGLQQSPSPSMTTEELAYLLQLKASISGLKSPQQTPSQVINTSG